MLTVGPFIPVEPLKKNKKTKLNHEEAIHVKHVFEINLQIVFSQ